MPETPEVLQEAKRPFAFDAIYCPTGFGTGGSQDALLLTYDGTGISAAAVAFIAPDTSGSLVYYPGSVALVQQAYQITCDANGYVTMYYGGKLNRFAPGGTATTPLASVPAGLPYLSPFGLSTDNAGNVFYAQANRLLAWDGTSPTPNTVSLPFTPGNIAVVP